MSFLSLTAQSRGSCKGNEQTGTCNIIANRGNLFQPQNRDQYRASREKCYLLPETTESVGGSPRRGRGEEERGKTKNARAERTRKRIANKIVPRRDSFIFLLEHGDKRHDLSCVTCLILCSTLSFFYFSSPKKKRLASFSSFFFLCFS